MALVVAVAMLGGEPLRARQIEPPVAPGRPDPPQAASENNLIRVEVSSAIGDAETYQEWVNNGHPDIESRFPEAIGHEQWILVEIGGFTYDYELTVTAMRDGQPVGPVDEPLSCDCDTNSLFTLIDERLDEALERLHSSQVEPEEVMSPRLPTPAMTTNLPPPKPRRNVSPLGPLGYAGLGGAILGVGAVGGGIALIRRSDEYRGAPGSVEVGTSRPSGIAWTVIGSAAVAAGIALTVVDVVWRRRRRAPTPTALRLDMVGRSRR